MSQTKEEDDRRFHNMEAKLIYVQTNNSNQKVLLDSEYLSNNRCFVVPQNEMETVQSIIRSQFFQYFQNSITPLAQKIKQFAFRMLQNTISLTLLRDILTLVSEQDESLKRFKQYFLDINRQIAQESGEDEEMLLNIQDSQEEDKEYLFQLAEKGQMRATRLLQQLEICQEIDEGCRQFVPEKTVTINTQQTAKQVSNPQQTESKQVWPIANNILSAFYSAEVDSNVDWWKKQNRISDESKQISRFNCRGGKVINQKSITRLVIEEMKRDLNRQIQLGKQIHKHQEGHIRFSKAGKVKLVQAKMKKRGRK